MISRLPRTVTRFATVGVANTAIDVALFWMLHPSIGIVAANLLSTSAGMTFSFVVNGRHTFGTARLTGRQAVAFLASNAFTMWLLQPVVIVTAEHAVGLPVMVCKLVALAASMVANFLLYRYVVWPAGADRATGEDAVADTATERVPSTT